MNSELDCKNHISVVNRSNKSKNSSPFIQLKNGTKSKRKVKPYPLHKKGESLTEIQTGDKIKLHDMNILLDESIGYLNLQSPSPRIMKKEEEEELERLRLERMSSGIRRGAFYALNSSTGLSKEFDINETINEAPSSNSGLITLSSIRIRGNKARKHNIVSRSKRLHCGYAETIGRRSRMEDNFIFNGNVEGNELLDFFGVFDGHNGVEASKFVAKRMGKILMKNLEKKQTDIKKMLKKTFLMTNKQMLKENVLGGTTAVVGLFKDDICYIVNVGDSRAVFSTNGKIKKITKDHKPDRIDEIKRITELGGEITSMVTKDGKIISRVQGILSVSRSFGDFELAPFITAEPEIYEIPLVDSEDHNILILACDGLWDVISDQEATNIAHTMVKKYDVEKAAKKLRDIAYDRGSTDNITVMLIKFLKDKEIKKEKMVVSKKKGKNKTL